jgi:hypothetical protein
MAVLEAILLVAIGYALGRITGPFFWKLVFYVRERLNRKR